MRVGSGAEYTSYTRGLPRICLCEQRKHSKFPYLREAHFES